MNCIRLRIVINYKINNMKKTASVFLISISMLAFSCGPKDADIDNQVTDNIRTAAPGANVDVADGVVTLSGTVADESSKAAAETAAKGTKGVKSVVNNLTVAASVTVPEVMVSPDDALRTGVTDALKDFPTAQATVADGEITVTGELTSAQWRRLKESLDALAPKKVTATGLKIK
jgi:hyperosmotically inducible protein